MLRHSRGHLRGEPVCHLHEVHQPPPGSDAELSTAETQGMVSLEPPSVSPHSVAGGLQQNRKMPRPRTVPSANFSYQTLCVCLKPVAVGLGLGNSLLLHCSLACSLFAFMIASVH